MTWLQMGTYSSVSRSKNFQKSSDSSGCIAHRKLKIAFFKAILFQKVRRGRLMPREI
jgi:hypothetical protein